MEVQCNGLPESNVDVFVAVRMNVMALVRVA